MRFGSWLPVFGGWLRNVDNEGMAPTWEYVRTLAQKSEASCSRPPGADGEDSR